MNEQQPHISLGAVVAVMLAGAVAAVALFVALPSYGQALGPDAGDREKICWHGYSRSVRPYPEITNPIKDAKALEQGVSLLCCELDHIVPLCLGGAPLDPDNLQLQPWPEAKEKDVIETHTCRDWCDGYIELPEALARFKRTHP